MVLIWWCMTVCSQCVHTVSVWDRVEWPKWWCSCIAIHYSRKHAWMMRRCASSTRQGVLHCLGRPAGGPDPESLIWSEPKNWTRSRHSQGIQQKDSPYTISGFPHACVVSLGTIFRSILFLGKENMALFSFENILDLAFSFLFDKYYPIMD